MKISKSKQELARIISENGGWRNGEFAAQDGDGGVGGYEVKPEWNSRSKYWWREALGEWFFANKIKNHHQTVLSRSEYFHLYPMPDADWWIEWEGGECPVEGGVLIDVKYRDGAAQKQMAAREPVAGSYGVTEPYWRCDMMGGDIIAYRLHKPEQAEASQAERDEQVWTNPPTIEQLAADYRNAKDYAERKQQEADDAKADADARLKALEIAAEDLGFKIEPITTKQDGL